MFGWLVQTCGGGEGGEATYEPRTSSRAFVNPSWKIRGIAEKIVESCEIIKIVMTPGMPQVPVKIARELRSVAEE